MDVGVRELKAKLSEYLDRAESGELIRVTDRGKPKALLGPLPGGGDRIEQGIREGWITPASNPGPFRPLKRRFKATRTLDEILAEDRGE
jgi:prevent-host-death family protein